MAIGAVSGATSANSLQASSLGLQDFLKILLTQLTYQDPLKPVDNTEFMAQIAQFTALQQTQELNAKMDQLISTQSALQSVGLIGKNVSITTTDGAVSGSVTGLSFANTLPEVTIETGSGAILTGISLSQIVQVR